MRWGNWELCDERWLVFSGSDYEIPIWAVKREEEIADVILRVARLGWAEVEDLRDLTFALQAVRGGRCPN